MRAADIARNAPLAYLNELTLCLEFARGILGRELMVSEIIELHQALLYSSTLRRLRV